MGHLPAARHQEPVNPPAGISPIGDNRLSHDIKENASVLMTFRVPILIQRKYKPPKTSRDSSSTNRTKLLSVHPTPTFLLQISRYSKVSFPTSLRCHLPQRRTCVDPMALPRRAPCAVFLRHQLSVLLRRQRIRPFPPQPPSFKTLSSRSLDFFRQRHLRVFPRSLLVCPDVRTRDVLLLQTLRLS